MHRPMFIAHADWGTDRRKRQVATAHRTSAGTYLVDSLAAADDAAVANGELRVALHVHGEGQLFAGFDFPIGVPIAYAKRVGVVSFPDLLPLLGHGPWDRFYDVATTPDEVTIHRPFYPNRPGGAFQAHLFDGLQLTRRELRRLCDGDDAETMFWTLGGKQVGKAALAGWRFLSSTPVDSVRLWPFHGRLGELLGEGLGDVVGETYPRLYYGHIKAPRASTGPWSKRRQNDRLTWMPRLLEWANDLGVEWNADVRGRVEVGFSDGVNGEDEFDAVVGLLGMVAVVKGRLESGEPTDNGDVGSVEGWILGRTSGF